MARDLDRSVAFLSRYGSDRFPRTWCDDEVFPFPATGHSSGRSRLASWHWVRLRPPAAGRLLASRHVPDPTARVLHTDGVLDPRSGRTIRPASGALTPRPCSGAFCSGQPAVPAVPAGMSDGRMGSWPLCSSAPAYAWHVLPSSPRRTTAPRPVHRGSGVFHPPRYLLRSVQTRPPCTRFESTRRPPYPPFVGGPPPPPSPPPKNRSSQVVPACVPPRVRSSHAPNPSSISRRGIGHLP